MCEGPGRTPGHGREQGACIGQNPADTGLQDTRSARVIPVMEPAASSHSSRSGGQWGWGSSGGAGAHTTAVSVGHGLSAAAVSRLKTIREGGEPGGRM